MYIVPIPYDIPLKHSKGSIDDIKEISGILYKSSPSYYFISLAVPSSIIGITLITSDNILEGFLWLA